MQNNNLLTTALAHATIGFSVIPVRGEDKKPFLSWEEYQKRRATPDEIKAWWAKHPKAMIGIICGEISGIFVIDCDNAEAYEIIQKALPDSFVCPIAKTHGAGTSGSSSHHITEWQTGQKSCRMSMPGPRAVISSHPPASMQRARVMPGCPTFPWMMSSWARYLIL